MADRIWEGDDATSPTDASVAANWGGTVPIAGDDVIFDSTGAATGITAGLTALAGIALGSVTFDGCSYPIGTATTDFDLESDEYYVRSATGTVYIDTGSATTATINVDSATSFNFVGTNASNVLNQSGGTVNAGNRSSEAVTLLTVNKSGGTLNIGDGATLTTVNSDAGTTTIKSAITTLNVVAGTTTIGGTGAITTINMRGTGTVAYNTTGTLTTGNIDNGGTIDFSGSSVARTVTNLDLDGNGSVKYDDKYVTVTNLNEGTYNSVKTITVS